MVSITKEKDGMLWEDMERTLEKEKMDAGKGGIWCSLPLCLCLLLRDSAGIARR